MSGEPGDLQRPQGDRGPSANPAGGPSRDRAIGATSPWTGGPGGAWWREDTATPAGTSTPPWRAESPAPAARTAGPTPTTPGPFDPPRLTTDTATDEIPAVRGAATDELPAVPADTNELPKVPADTDELPAVTGRTTGTSGYGNPAPQAAPRAAEARRRPAAPVDSPPPAEPVDSAPAVRPERPAPVPPRAPAPAVPAVPARPAAAPSAAGEARPETPASDESAAFWLPVEEVSADGDAWPAQRMRGGRGPARRSFGDAPPSRPGKPRKPPRNPAVGLVSLVLLSLVAAFFAWVSAEPLWLAVGHGKTGSATVTRCTGSGVQQRCVGTFTATSGGFTTESVRLLGVENQQRAEGTQVTARMIDAGGRSAYVGSAAGPLHLRWALGLALVVLCGLGIVWGTGALRLTDRRSRRRATITALGGPLLVAVGFLAAAF